MLKSKIIQDIPADKEAEEAIRTLIRWLGDDPERAGLQNTPESVLAFYRDFFKGYRVTSADYAGSVARDVRYDDFIMVRDIRLVSFCEHHMLPSTGTAHIAYIPGKKIAGIGTIARIATDCAARLTTQETMTLDILSMIEQAFAPTGVAIYSTMAHGCMTLRGPQQQDSSAIMTKFTGIFQDKPEMQKQFLMLIQSSCDTD